MNDMRKSAMTHKPRVSIGMPLYNAELLLERAFTAILAQTFTDFELIVSDNASTDRTWEICNTYARQDSRIKLYRNEKNEGATYNFVRVCELGIAEYFIWASYDDLWEPRLLESCVQALDDNPAAVLAFSSIQCYHTNTGFTEVIPLNFRHLPSQSWQRAVHFLQHKPLPSAIIYGLYRRSVMERLLPFPSGYGSDNLWLLNAILIGDFVQVEPILFTYTHVGRRDIRTRLKQYTGHRTGIGRLLHLDWAFILNLLQITQAVAPSFQIRLKLFWVALVYCNENLGWPFSLRLIQRYGGLLLPESLYQKIITRKSKP